MIDDNAKKLIRNAADCELAAITARHGGKYASNPEAHSVLLEEVEEADEGMTKLTADFDKLWNAVRENSLKKSDVEGVLDAAVQTIGELVQVAAVCERWLLGVKDENA